jgi:hypothetical protein
MMLEKMQALTQTNTYIDIVLRHGFAPLCRTCSNSPEKTAGGERRSKLELAPKFCESRIIGVVGGSNMVDC